MSPIISQSPDRVPIDVDLVEVERELRDQAMYEDGFTSLRRWMPTRQQGGAA